MKKLCTLCLALYCLALFAGSGFLLPDIISNNMVLQQQTGVRLWGKASPGSVVSVKGDWSGEAVSVKVAKDSTWIVKLLTPAASMQKHTPLQQA